MYNLISVKNRHKLPADKALVILKAVGLTKEQINDLIGMLLDNKPIEIDKIINLVPLSNFKERMKKALEARKSDLTNKEIAKKYHVGIASLYNYARKLKQNTKKLRATESTSKKTNQSKQLSSRKSKSKKVRHEKSRPPKQAKINLRAKQTLVTKKPSKSIEQKTAEPKTKQNSGITLFKPEHANALSPLAQAVKDNMANKQMNVRSLVYRTGLNRKRLHEFFKGDIQTLSRLTVFRLTLGLKMNPDKMMKLNHPEIIVKTVPLDDKLQPRDINTEPKPANNQTSLKELVSIAKELNNADLHILKAMANRMQLAEKYAD